VTVSEAVQVEVGVHVGVWVWERVEVGEN
jgi:hypothetical protein